MMNKVHKDEKVITAIETALVNLSNSNQMLFDYWVSELYVGDRKIDEMWNAETLNLMETDVMYQSLN